MSKMLFAALGRATHDETIYQTTVINDLSDAAAQAGKSLATFFYTFEAEAKKSESGHITIVGKPENISVRYLSTIDKLFTRDEAFQYMSNLRYRPLNEGYNLETLRRFLQHIGLSVHPENIADFCALANLIKQQPEDAVFAVGSGAIIKLEQNTVCFNRAGIQVWPSIQKGPSQEKPFQFKPPI